MRTLLIPFLALLLVVPALGRGRGSSRSGGHRSPVGRSSSHHGSSTGRSHRASTSRAYHSTSSHRSSGAAVHSSIGRRTAAAPVRRSTGKALGASRGHGARAGASARRASPTLRTSPATQSHRSTSVRCVGCPRDGSGRIARNPAARSAFMRSHPCPATGRTSGACPGYVVDHIRPLKRGGADAPSNMQWQTAAAAKAKDRVE